MASTLDKPKKPARERAGDDAVAAVVDVRELADARNDARVVSFLCEADAYLAELDAGARND